MRPGLYAGLTNEEYHGGAGISKSGLDLIARSPLHYWQRYINPEREPVEPTAAMKLGTAIHTAVLEPGEFKRRHHVAPQVDRRTKDGKAAWEAALAEAEEAGADLISASDYDTCMRISEQVNSHPTARKLFGTVGQAETSIYWIDRETGVLCKCRPDWLAMPMIVDLKSTDDASAQGFQRSAWNYRYWVQAAWYMDGIEQATGQRPDAFVFAAFEKTAPHACAFYFAEQAMLDMGRAEYRKLLRIYADCMETGRWPGYDTTVQPLGIPLWAAKAANDNQP
jgi:PDDEXK-like domain of unknown function (DUF3799)